MKKYLSVFEMITRSTLYRVLLAVFIMAVVQFGSFYFTMQQSLAGAAWNLEELFTQSHFALLLGIAYLAVTAFLMTSGCNIGSVQTYTLQRLRISEKRIYCLQSIYNMCCYVLLWGTQLAVLLLSAGYYFKYQNYAKVSNQTLFLAFHRSAFLHSILPLEDVWGWCLLLFIIIGTGFAAAAFPWQQRRKQIKAVPFLITAAALLVFPRELGSGIGGIFISAGILLLYLFYQKLLSKWNTEEL